MNAVDIPPRIDPPQAFPVGLNGLLTLIRNPIAAIPAACFREDRVAVRFFGKTLLWLSDPEQVRAVLLEQADAFVKSPVERRIFGPVLGDGIMMAEGEQWRWQRRAAAPLFRHGELLAAAPAINRIADDFLSRCEREPAPRSISDDMGDATFSVLVATLLDGSTAAEKAELRREIDAFLSASAWEAAYGLIGLPPGAWHPARKRMRLARDRRRAIADAYIARRVGGGATSEDLLGHFARAIDPQTGAPMSPGLLNDNLQTFFGAGHETSARTLSWALLLLARYPDWQKRIRAEVERVCGDGPIEAAHVERLDITRQVLNEAMRLYPPAPILTRVATGRAQVHGLDIAPGTVTLIPIYAIHRHEKHWRDPDHFDPERFSDWDSSRMRRSAFMPFGAGRRTCLGSAFAMIELLILLGRFIRGATFERIEGRADPRLLHRVHLRPEGGVHLRVTPLRALPRRDAG